MRLPINYKDSHCSVRKQAREQYAEIQHGCCWFCGAPLASNPTRKVQFKKINFDLFPKTMFDYPVHLHHCHKTGLTIGAVHAKCNAVLWQYYGE